MRKHLLVFKCRYATLNVLPQLLLLLLVLLLCGHSVH